MTTLAEVRDGLEARLNTITGLRVYDYIPDDAFYPAAVIDITDVTYTSLDIGAGRRAVFAIYLLIPRAVDRQQLELYPLIDNGPGSVLAAIKADPTLGGLAANAQVIGGPVALDTSQIGLTNLYGRTITVNVFVS